MLKGPDALTKIMQLHVDRQWAVLTSILSLSSVKKRLILLQSDSHSWVKCFFRCLYRCIILPPGGQVVHTGRSRNEWIVFCFFNSSHSISCYSIYFYVAQWYEMLESDVFWVVNVVTEEIHLICQDAAVFQCANVGGVPLSAHWAPPSVAMSWS